MSLDGQLSKRLTGLWRTRRAWISEISKKFRSGPRPSFAPFAANGQALQGVHQIDVRSGKSRSRKTSDTRRNRTGRPLTQAVLTLSNFSPIYHSRLTIHHRRTTIPDMPHASQRYSADAIISNRAALGDGAFDGFSRTVNGQAPSRESQFCTPDPVLPLPSWHPNSQLSSSLS